MLSGKRGFTSKTVEILIIAKAIIVENAEQSKARAEEINKLL